METPHSTFVLGLFASVLCIIMIIDDFAPISCSILSTQNIDGHTEYEIECRRQYGYLEESTKSWTTDKRFSDFANLDSSLNQSGSQVDLNLPKKKIVGNMGNGKMFN